MSHNAVTGNDSPFSITGNVIGILTFLLGLFASYIAFVNLARDSDEELDEFMEDVQITTDQMAALRKALPPIQDQEFTNPVRVLEVLVRGVESVLSTLLRDLSKKGRHMKGPWRPDMPTGRRNNPRDFQLRRKVVWLFRRRKLLAQMSKMRALKAEVYLAQNTVLLK